MSRGPNMNRGVFFFRSSQPDSRIPIDLPRNPEAIDLDACTPPPEHRRLTVQNFLNLVESSRAYYEDWYEVLFDIPGSLPEFNKLLESDRGRDYLQRAADSHNPGRARFVGLLSLVEQIYSGVAKLKDSSPGEKTPRYVSSVGPELCVPDSSGTHLVLVWNAGYTKLLEADLLPAKSPRDETFRRLLGRALSRAKAIVVNSLLDAEFVLHHGSTRDRIISAVGQPPPFDPDPVDIGTAGTREQGQQKPLIERWNSSGAQTSPVTIGIWGSFVPENSIRTILFALGQFREAHGDFGIKFFTGDEGNLAYERDCRFILDCLGLGDYASWCSQHDSDALADCHFLVFGELDPQPAHRLRPAMAAGCIVLATDLPWNRPSLRHDRRRLFAPYTPSALSDSLRHFTQNPDQAQLVVTDQLRDLDLESIRNSSAGLFYEPNLPRGSDLERSLLDLGVLA